MACDCFETTDKALREKHGAGLVWSIQWNPETGEQMEPVPSIAAYLVPAVPGKKLKRGAKAPVVIPTYCPFCGDPYDTSKNPSPKEALTVFYETGRAILGIPGYRWSPAQIDNLRTLLDNAARRALAVIKPDWKPGDGG